jgi:hypothetical protein
VLTSCSGSEAVEGVLGVDARLDRVSLEGDVVLGEGQRFARRHAQLQLDEVDPLAANPHDLLGDRVLDLEAGVHLEEVELAGAPCGISVEQELDRPGAGVAALCGERDGRRRDGRTLLGADRGSGRLLQHLLVPSLGGAVALEEVDDVAVGVAEDLHLDVAPGLDVLLHQQGVVAERLCRLAPGRVARLDEVRRAAHDAHALAAAAGRGLDQHGIGEGRGVVVEGVRRHDRHAGREGDLARLVLAAHRVHHHRARADEHDVLGTGALQRAGEGAVLRQEAVARVDEAGATVAGRGEDRVDVEVGPDPDGGVGGAYVGSVGVEVGVDGDGPPAEAVRGAHHPQGDLAAVGDEECVHLTHILKMP